MDKTKWVHPKHVAQYYLKSLVNFVFKKFGKPNPCKISKIELRCSKSEGGFPNRQINASKRIWRISFKETLIGHSVVIFLVCVGFALLWGAINGWPEFGDLLVEFWGLIFDVLVILVLYGVIQYRKQRRDDIARHEEIIEDLKWWDSDEAKHRIFGAMRRLNKVGKTNFALSGAKIKNASFLGLGVSSISGSTLSGDGEDWINDENTVSEFDDVDFSNLNACNVVFGKSHLLLSYYELNLVMVYAKYTNCSFCNSGLSGAKFDGAELFWLDEPPETLDKVIDEEPDGRPIFVQVAKSNFNNTDLAETSFQYCKFKWADFREAHNIEAANFFGAKGLETCVFDNEELKQKIIQKSKGRPA